MKDTLGKAGRKRRGAQERDIEEINEHSRENDKK